MSASLLVVMMDCRALSCCTKCERGFVVKRVSPCPWLASQALSAVVPVCGTVAVLHENTVHVSLQCPTPNPSSWRASGRRACWGDGFWMRRTPRSGRASPQTRSTKWWVSCQSSMSIRRGGVRARPLALHMARLNRQVSDGNECDGTGSLAKPILTASLPL